MKPRAFYCGTACIVERYRRAYDDCCITLDWNGLVSMWVPAHLVIVGVS